MSCRNGRKRRAGPRFRVGQQDAKFHAKPRLLLGRQTCTATVRVSCQEHILCCAGVSSEGISKGSTETTRGRYATRTTGAATAHMGERRTQGDSTGGGGEVDFPRPAAFAVSGFSTELSKFVFPALRSDRQRNADTRGRFHEESVATEHTENRPAENRRSAPMFLSIPSPPRADFSLFPPRAIGFSSQASMAGITIVQVEYTASSWSAPQHALGFISKHIF
uniref:Uncharacterized protein n=1 Tax=Toxoplasma gondii COUG TaxID=1074873 RepID=A0A2G8XTN5_TOXGO|nr:hypothetical protein TGCOUG_312120 [Toxoplasma gondii COUG]